jgi:hypothetical protein
MYMGQITRRGLVMRGGAVAGASMLGYSRKARSADFAYKFGHGFPNSHPFPGLFNALN